MKLTRLLAGLVGAALALAALACDRGEPAPAAPPAAAEASGPEGALATVLRDPDPYTRIARLAELLPTLGADAIPAVHGQLLGSRANLGAGEFELLMRFWASHEPENAARWAFALVAPSQRKIAAPAAVEEWARLDTRAALDGLPKVVRKDTDGDSLWAARLGLMRSWMQKDAAGLEQYVRGLGVTAERENWVLGYALVLAQTKGADAVVRWAEGVPTDDEGYKRSVNYQVATLLASFDPETARKWCDENCDGPYAIGTRPTIVLNQLRAGEDPKIVVEWLTAAPRSEENDQTLATAYGTWARRAPDAALPWMAEKLRDDEEPWLKKLLAPYARNLAHRSPSEAITWAEKVEDPAQRQALLVEIARDWRVKDEAAAEAWLVGSSLPEDARQTVRTPPEPEKPFPIMQQQAPPDGA